MKHLLFVIYVTRVGEKIEHPISKVISEAEEESYRDYMHSHEWNNWADKNRVYRNARIEVKQIGE